jgi:hypothetical protein
VVLSRDSLRNDSLFLNIFPFVIFWFVSELPVVSEGLREYTVIVHESWLSFISRQRPYFAVPWSLCGTVNAVREFL